MDDTRTLTPKAIASLLFEHAAILEDERNRPILTAIHLRNLAEAIATGSIVIR
jgi:hypothetical protein